jgi:hypothetical protein
MYSMNIISIKDGIWNIWGVIPVHQVYNMCTPPLHMGWIPQCVGPTSCEGVVYICCTLSVQLSLFGIYCA